MRQANITRKTLETNIAVSVNLDGTGKAKIATKAGFFNHMLEQLTCHSLIDIELEASGDEHIDFHHMVEDCGYALGHAIADALGDKKAIARYGYAYAPMDEALARTVIDFSGRPALFCQLGLVSEKIGDFDTELFPEFFKSFSHALGAALHIEVFYGENDHHRIEAVFKSLAMALRQAVCLDARKTGIPSTKGSLAGAGGS